jgi:tripartite-type tricarboxylate transporter receptor subunit TctC
MRLHLRALAALALILPAAIAHAYPDKPIRILVPFASGGSTDILARMLGQKLTEAWGQQVVIDNRAGANGVLAASLAAQANPDGHTLLMVAIGHAINPSLQKTLPYDTSRDFAPLSLTAILPLLVAVHPLVKATSVQELIALARNNAKPVTYASGGVGSSQHLAAELMNFMARIKMTHVPYKGGNPGLLDVVGGHVGMMVSTIITVTPHAKAGRLRALAITTARRNTAWPDLPTVAESGLKGYESIAWYGMVAPAGLPPAVATKLATVLADGARSDAMREVLVNQGAEPVGSTPREFADFIKSETAKYAHVIREAGIKPE